MFIETAAITFGILGSLFAAVFSRIKDPLDIAAPASQKNKSSLERLTPQQLEEQVMEVADSLNLPAEQVKMYWSSFVKYDKDGSGTVDSSELKGMLLDTIGFQPSDEEITVMVSDADADGNGVLEFAEFCLLAARLDMGEQSQEDLRASFEMWSEKEPTISGEKMRKALTEFGDKLTEEEVAQFMREADVNSDGDIDFKEFLRAMAWRKQDFSQDFAD